LRRPDGLVRNVTSTPAGRMSYDAYLSACALLSDHFGNSFQMMDLWNNGIPTLEEYVRRLIHFGLGGKSHSLGSRSPISLA
jgi:hypothetical protein